MPSLLLTAFEPFENRETNESARTARELERLLTVAGWKVKLLVLPVEFDRAAGHVLGMQSAEAPPDIALSLGEGTCPLRLETAAHNLDHAPGRPDNAGVERIDHVILPGSPDILGFSLPVDRMYAALDAKERAETLVSESPGGYVCNNTAYLLCAGFGATGVPYGFIHVPSRQWPGYSPDSSVIHADRIARMLEALNVVNGARQPASLVEARARLDAARGQAKREFYERLLDRWIERERSLQQ